jgi:oligopeptidase B
LGRFVNLIRILIDKIKNTGNTWAGDNKTIFYTTRCNTLRSDTVLKHKLGTDTAEDEVVYFEKMIPLMWPLVKENQKIF